MDFSQKVKLKERVVEETPDEVREEAAASAETATQTVEVPQEVEVFVGHIYTWAGMWLFVIISSTMFWRIMTRKWAESDWQKTSLVLVPFVLGTATAPIFGPTTAAGLGFDFTPAGALIFGPGAGLTAMGIWSVRRPILDRFTWGEWVNDTIDKWVDGE